MYIRDVNDNLVTLDGKDICISIDKDGYNWRTRDGDTKYDAAVITYSSAGAFGENDSHTEYYLHWGTVAECRDFMKILAAKLGPVLSIECSSTPRPERIESKLAPTEGNLSF